jgi:NADPH-dependent curcumin reductase CurA
MDIYKPETEKPSVVSGAAGASKESLWDKCNYKAVVSWACLSTDEKQAMIDHFGFDQVINYKTT